MGVQTLTNQDGECIIEQVLPGTYRIAVPGQMYSTVNRPNHYGRSGTFAVIDRDTEIIVKAVQGISVSGVVVIEGTPDPRLQAMLPNKQFTISSIPLEPGQRISSRSASNQADGSFLVDGFAPGRLGIGMTMPSEAFPVILMRTEHQGVEQKDQIQLKGGDHITALRLVLVYATGELRGTAKLSTGAFPANLKGMAMIYREGKYYFGVQIDSRGQFMFQHVPAGNYRLVLDMGTEGSQRISARGEQMVEVSNDKVSEVVIVMDPKTTPDK